MGQPIFINKQEPMDHITHLKTFNVRCCLIGIYRPIQEFFTYLDTTPLPVKAFKFDLYYDEINLVVSPWKMVSAAGLFIFFKKT